MKKVLEKIKEGWQWITLLITIIASVGGLSIKMVRYFDDQNEEMNRTLQMAEKSIIWNKDIPRIERASICDDHLSHGWNSYTKKLCENVILNEDYQEVS